MSPFCKAAVNVVGKCVVLHKKDILWTGGSGPAHDLHRPAVVVCTVSGRLYTNRGSLPPAREDQRQGRGNRRTADHFTNLLGDTQHNNMICFLCKVDHNHSSQVSSSHYTSFLSCASNKGTSYFLDANNFKRRDDVTGNLLTEKYNSHLYSKNYWYAFSSFVRLFHTDTILHSYTTIE